MNNSKVSVRALVPDAALTVMRHGERPSAKNVHALIGRGSLSTIQDELQIWWKSLAHDLSDASDNTPKRVTELANAMWAMALQKAAALSDPNHPDGQGAAKELLSLQRETQSLHETVETGEARIRELEKSLTVAEAVNEELRSQAAYLKTALGTLQTDVIDARAFHKQQIELAENRYQEMENRMMIMLDEERQARKGAEETVKRLRFGAGPQR